MDNVANEESMLVVHLDGGTKLILIGIFILLVTIILRLVIEK